LGQRRTTGGLRQGKPLGNCPLKHTVVTADISGFIARVTVRQQFHNPFAEKIEAVYVFPLSHDGAVDRMTMKIGDRRIEGRIKDRHEARATYETAKAQGHVASLLQQQRPNIFRQSVANIEPGENVEIAIRYSATLQWKDGEYEFVFPTVVGPRYMPGQPTGPATTGWSPPTDRVPDASEISPPVPEAGTRAGHDISMTVKINAGLPIRRLAAQQHDVDIEYTAADKSCAVITLQQKRTIPNKDFVLVYQTATDEISDTVLAHTDDRGKFFTIVLQPPQRVRRQAMLPKELYFVIDSSGSMRGFPIESAKKVARIAIEGLHERDTFNLMTFSGHTSYCFEKPVPNTAENRGRALAFLDHLVGSSGTEMLPAIEGCLAAQDDAGRVRTVCFLTDGYVGNDAQIIAAVKRHAGTARVFAFGVGTSVNRYLLDGMARAGRGEARYVLDQRDAGAVANEFCRRIRTPVLTDIKLSFGKLDVAEVFPGPLPDLFASTPIVIKGQYRTAGEGVIALQGRTGEGEFTREIRVDLPAHEPGNEVLAALWARAKVDHLMTQDPRGGQSHDPPWAIQGDVLDLGLRFHLLTPMSSFVAVEERITTEGKPRVVAVPVEMPEDVSRAGVFGQYGGNRSGVTTDYLVMRGGRAAYGRAAGGLTGAMFSAGAATGSEQVVATGLGWVARHQRPDGSWSFAHYGQQCADKTCTGAGRLKSDAAATALALLPMLGAGQTHKNGKYAKTVANGLAWLMKNQKPDGDLAADGDEPAMTHALATIALCETFSITNDKAIAGAAESAIRFTVAGQDKPTGGWPGKPGGPPRTSVTVLQFLALKSAQIAHLKVPQQALVEAGKFLDSVQAEGGAKYGETSPKDVSDAATVMALLARQRLGWEPDHPTMKRAAEQIAKAGPSKNDPVYNVFATVLLHNCAREQWSAWNRPMREILLDAQCRRPHNGKAKVDCCLGSWPAADSAPALEGGRLMQTALGLLTLEVYYRHLPLFWRDPD
jgi:Ca-activated chloride channel family protein